MVAMTYLVLLRLNFRQLLLLQQFYHINQVKKKHFATGFKSLFRCTRKTKGSILQGAQGWEVRAGQGRKLTFPSIVHTNLRPDIVVRSERAEGGPVGSGL